MMAAQVALHGRAAAAATLQDAVRELTRYKNADMKHPRLLRQKLDSVLAAKEMLVSKHYLYAEKAAKELDSEELVDWITPKLDSAVDLADAVYIQIENLESVNKDNLKSEEEAAIQAKKENTILVAELQCQADEKILIDRVRVMMEVVNDVNKRNKEDAMLVRAYLLQVEESMREQIKSWKVIKTLPLLTEEKLKEVFAREEEVKKHVADRRSLAITFINNIDPETTKGDEVVSTSDASISSDGPEARLRLEKMKNPVFSGDIRSFARFKADFETIVVPSYTNPVHQTYVLKECCLRGEPKKLIENMNDIDEIWERLHGRYGDIIEVVNAVIKDIENLHLVKYDYDQNIINLADTVEKGVQDLSAINAKHEIANAYTVKLLETKLPRQVLTRWLEKEEHSNGKDRFEKMLEFLKQERKHAERLLLLKDKPDGKDHKQTKDTRKSHFNGNIDSKPEKREGKLNPNNCCLLHPNSSHLTRKCQEFLAMNVEERGKTVKDTKGCKLCLSLSHVDNPCPFESKWGKCKIKGCEIYHSRLVHGCKVQGVGFYMEISNAQYNHLNNTLLLIERIRTPNEDIIAFWDSGSTLALITKDYAIRNNLQGIPVSYDLITVGGNITTHNTTLYELTLIDRDGENYVLKVYEIDDICGEMRAIRTDKFTHLFPSTLAQEIARPGGKIELLIGMEYASIHPKPVGASEGLVLYESMFGTGKILGGMHHGIQDKDEVCSIAQKCAHSQLVNVRISRKLNPGIDFFTAEDFGVKIPPRCNKCKGCRECRFETQQISRIEQQELDVIRENLQLDPIENKWTTKYPYKCDPAILQNNKTQAIAMTLKTEKRLSKDKRAAEKYNEQFDDFLKRGIFKEITKEDERNYDGPIFYITHHEVFKPGSSSTPVRLVINSSLKYNNISLNDILMKGPNSLNDLFGIQLRFRIHEVALVGDIQKMYHTIHTTELERHLRRVLWRNMRTEEEFKTYGIETVTFGDKPAAAISTVAIQETADIYKYINEESSEKIKRDTYVDDITTGDSTKEIVSVHKENISEILNRGGFKIKGFVMSGDDSEETLSLLGSGEVGRVLGVSWNPTADEFSVEVKINISQKYKGARVGKDYTYEEIPQLSEATLTRRILLGVVNSCYDPYGLVSPITIQMKIELRNLYNKEMNFGWDDPLPIEIKRNWIRILQIMKDAEQVKFRRCIKPKDTVGNPDLIVCNDGSTEAMCSTAHVRWKLKSGDYECCLYASKTRVTPLQKQSIPRIEMQSAVLAVRLSKSIVTHSEIEFNKIIHILDSKCTLATLRKDTAALREYMGNRVSEILSSTTTDQWFHVKSKDNIADLGTRKTARIEDILRCSDWQLGPSWMRQPMEDWPTSQDTCGISVPMEELTKNTSVVAFASENLDIFDISRFKGRSYIFLLRVTAIVMKVVRSRSFRITELMPVDIDEAERFCVKASMALTKQDYDKGKLRSLRPQINEDGIISINSRAVKEMKIHYGNDNFPILTYNDPLAYIWMQDVHKEDHTGITKTVAKSRRRYWILKARRLATKVKRSCYRCRLIDKLLAEQQMAPLPDSRLKIAPPFYTTSMDLFGPIEIKDTVKQRTRKKVWGAIFSCTVTRALYLDLTEDYGTDAILQTIRRFVSIRGCPSEIQSDQGSQLIAAAKDIAQLVGDWDWKPVQEWATTNKIKWTLAPAEGQHLNGLSESLIKTVKRSIKHKITANNVLTFSQLQMIHFEIANIINSRPIGIITGSDPEQPSPITPNDLILGRATSDVPQGPFDVNQSKNVNKKFRFLQSLVASWWESWYQTVLPSLVPNYKWLQRHRNVKVGDVCLIRYRNDLRATYRLGRVHEVKVGEDGLVRKVVLKYKLPNEKNYRMVDRPIHGISVIVPIEEQTHEDEDIKHVSTFVDSYLNPEATEFLPRN